MNRTYLAVDLGASSGRVMSGTYDGVRLRLAEVHRFPNSVQARDGSLCWDLPALFAHVKQGLALAARMHGPTIRGVGVDTWGVDYVLLDAEGQIIGDAYAYRDPRTLGMMDEAFRRVARRQVYDITGIQFLPFNTLYQLLADAVHTPDRLQRAERLLFVPELFNYWLCGESRHEYTIGSTGQILDANSRGLATELLERMDIPARLFGDWVEPGQRLGEVLPDVARATGLAGVSVVAVGSHDTASAVAAVPFESERAAYLSSGTWSLMGIETRAPVINDRSYEFGFTNEGGVCGTIRLLKNITGLWLIQECRRNWEAEGLKVDFGEIARLASEAEAFTAFIDPDDPVFAEPGDMPARIQAWCRERGQSVPESPGAIARVVFESLAFRCRTVFRRLETLAGHRLEVLHIVGGGVRNALLNQWIADALDRPVRCGPVEATALGNLTMQMMADGVVADLAQARTLVRESFPIDALSPNPAPSLEAAYRRYMEVTRA